MYYLKIFVKSFLSLFAIMRVTGMSTRSPYSVILFLLLLYVFAKLHSDHIEGRIIPGDMTISTLLSVLFSTFTLSAQYPMILSSLTSPLFCAAVLLFTGTGLFLIYYYLCIWFFQTASALTLTGSGYSYAWIPFLTAVICLLCWTPYFLYEYPGIMTPDSINQYAQVIGAYKLSNQHSVVHTALIGICYHIGLSLTRDPHTGLALYTIAQMVFMAFVAGYVVRTLQKANVIMPVLILTICFYALMPYHGICVVTIWKDIPFAGCMTLFAAALMRFLLRGSFASSSDIIPKLRPGEYVTLLLPYIVSGILLCLLRSNGWYTFVLSVPFILITYRKWWKIMLPVHLMILLLVLFVKYPVMHVYEIQQTDYAESLSLPVQQLACVIANGEPLSENEFTIGLRHPKACFDAYVAKTKGYWYPDVNCEIGLADGIPSNEYGLHWQPIIKGNIMTTIKVLLFKLPDLVPLYGMLWSMGFILWATLLLAALSLRMGKPAGVLICLPFILLTVTLCIAAPAAAEFRYAYAAFYALPLLVLSPYVHNSGWTPG